MSRSRSASIIAAILAVAPSVALGLFVNVAFEGSRLSSTLAWTATALLLVVSLASSAFFFRREGRQTRSMPTSSSDASQLLAEVSLLEVRANSLLSRDLLVTSSPRNSLSHMGVTLVEQSVWTEDDLIALRAALHTRNVVAHGDLDSVDDGALTSAVANIRLLRLKFEQWSSHANISSNGRIRTMTGHAGGIRGVSFLPDGTRLVSGGDDRAIRIWDIASGVQVRSLEGHADWVRVVSIAPDGTWLASGSDDRTIRIWDVSTGRLRTSLEGHAGGVFSVAIAPDGTWLASGSDDRTIRIWDVSTGRLRTSLEGHAGGVFSVAIAPDGNWLASGALDHTIRIWDVSTQSLRASLEGHAGGVFSVAIAPDGTWLASGSDDGTVRTWDAADRSLRMTFEGHTDRVIAVAIAQNAKWIASCSSDATIRIWSASTVLSDARLAIRSEDLAAVVDLLLETREILEPDVRVRIISLLPVQIGASVPYSPVARVHLLGLVRACSNFAGGREALLTALRLVLEGSHDSSAILTKVEVVLTHGRL